MSEGAPRHTSVVSVSARDPEGATVTYSVVSGDTGAHFSIGESTGVIRVMQALDREEVRLYSLVRQTSFSDIAHGRHNYADIDSESCGSAGESSLLFFRR